MSGYRHADAVAIGGLSQVANGYLMVLRSELQFARDLVVIHIYLIILRAFHFYLTLKIVAVVQIERQQTHTLAVLE